MGVNNVFLGLAEALSLQSRVFGLNRIYESRYKTHAVNLTSVIIEDVDKSYIHIQSIQLDLEILYTV
jgi:hypothetical protein